MRHSVVRGWKGVIVFLLLAASVRGACFYEIKGSGRTFILNPDGMDWLTTSKELITEFFVSEKIAATQIEKIFYDQQGWLSIGEQKFYIFNAERQSALASYQNNRLDFESVDINDDGYNDLIFSGLVFYSDAIEKHVYRQEPVVFIYLCDVSRQKFILKYKHASFDLEVENDASVQWEKEHLRSLHACPK